MSAPFVFQIRPLSVEKGFELECDGILPKPLRVHRLVEAIIASAQIGEGLNAEIQIFNTAGEVTEVMKFNRELVLAD